MILQIFIRTSRESSSSRLKAPSSSSRSQVSKSTRETSRPIRLRLASIMRTRWIRESTLLAERTTTERETTITITRRSTSITAADTTTQADMMRSRGKTTTQEGARVRVQTTATVPAEVARAVARVAEAAETRGRGDIARRRSTTSITRATTVGARGQDQRKRG